MKIAVYCRVSTDKEDQRNSLEAQKEFFFAYVKRTGHTLVKLYADEGISGTKIKNRREFLHMMEDAQKGLFELVVVKDISRFARNTVDLLQNIRRLKAMGIETQFLTANMTSVGDSEFALTIFGALAQEESGNMSKRVKFGKRINAKKGRVPNLVYGYDKTAGDYFHLAINRQEAEVVKQIYQWYTDEGYGAFKIARMLNEKGYKTKRNCSWSQKGICRILTNALYTGTIINGKEEVSDFLTGKRQKKKEAEWMVVDNPKLQIIEKETYQLAQIILHGRKDAFHLKRERQSNTYLFSTLIKCRECGRSFRRVVRTYKNTYVRWVCSCHNSQGADCCPNGITVDEEELMEVLQAYFAKELEEGQKNEDDFRKEIERCYKAKHTQIQKEKEQHVQLAKLKQTKQKYVELYVHDLLSLNELKEKINPLSWEIEQREKEEKLRLSPSGRGMQFSALLKQTCETMENILDLHQMTNVQLKTLIDRIEVDKEGNVDIYLRSSGGNGYVQEGGGSSWQGKN